MFEHFLTYFWSSCIHDVMFFDFVWFCLITILSWILIIGCNSFLCWCWEQTCKNNPTYSGMLKIFYLFFERTLTCAIMSQFGLTHFDIKLEDLTDPTKFLVKINKIYLSHVFIVHLECLWTCKWDFSLPHCCVVAPLITNCRVDTNKTNLLSLHCPNRILLIGW